MRLNTQWSMRTLFVGLFAVATLCLTIAIGYAIWNIEQLTRDSESLLTEGVRTTRLADELGDRITNIERTALQYGVIRSSRMLELFEDRRSELHTEISRLEAYAWQPPMMNALGELRARIEDVAKALADAPARFDLENSIHEEHWITMRKDRCDPLVPHIDGIATHYPPPVAGPVSVSSRA